MEPQLSSIIINTGHLEAVLTFYRKLGLVFSERKTAKGGVSYQGFVGSIELTFFSIPETAAPGYPQTQLCFKIVALDSLFAELIKISGVHGLMDPTLLPEGKKAILTDPDGRSVELFQVGP